MHGTHQKSNEEPLSYDEVLIVKVSYNVMIFVASPERLVFGAECFGDER